MTDISIEEAHGFVKYMEKLKIAGALRIARNVLIVGISFSIVAFLIGTAWHISNPSQPVQIIIQR